jgi:hypothetical protein
VYILTGVRDWSELRRRLSEEYFILGYVIWQTFTDVSEEHTALIFSAYVLLFS